VIHLEEGTSKEAINWVIAEAILGKVVLIPVAPRTTSTTVKDIHYLTLIGHFMVVE
jgi:hypothetical protein